MAECIEALLYAIGGVIQTSAIPSALISRLQRLGCWISRSLLDATLSIRQSGTRTSAK
jgi:hypothetical protein